MTIHRVETANTTLSTPARHHDGDPLWITVRPNLRRIHVLAGDILTALGKRRDVGGKGRNESEDVHLATAWLYAHHVADLVVAEAQRLHPRILASLTRLAAAADVDLWLLHRPPISDATHHAIRRWADTSTRLAVVPHPAEAPAATPGPVDTPRTPAAAVPSHDFHVFVAAVHATLPAAQAAAVLAENAAAARSTRTRIVSIGDPRRAVADEITDLLHRAPPDAELISRLRGIQTEAWNHDLHVAVDATQLLHSEERPRLPARLAAPTLLAYRQPHRAVTWILATHNTGLDEAAHLPIGAAAPNGSTITTRHGPIHLPTPLRAALRAQLALRADKPVDDPLLPYAPKTLARTLTTTENDLGLPSHGRLAERDGLTTTTWLRRLGITIRNLP